MTLPDHPTDAAPAFTLDLDVAPAECLVVLHHQAADTTLEVSGEIDVRTVHTLAEALTATAANGVERLVVDIDGVAFIGASGLNALVAAHAAQRDAGKELQVRATRPSTVRLLGLTGLSHLLVPA